MDIVQSLEIAELRKFTKDRYKKMVVSEIFELLPGANKQTVESTAHYISNMLNNEAQRQLSQKITENRKTNRRSTRIRNSLPTYKNDMVNRNVELKHDGNKTKLSVSNCVDLIETFINELEETLAHESDRTISDSQETTFTASQMDYTYEEAPASDDSVTEQKLLAQSSDRDKRNKDKNSRGKDEETITITDDDEILCIRSCSRNDSSGSIRLTYVLCGSTLNVSESQI